MSISKHLKQYYYIIILYPNNFLPLVKVVVLPNYRIINFSKLKTLHPEPRKGDSGSIRHLYMAVGSSMNVVMRGGPYPWFIEGMEHYTRG